MNWFNLKTLTCPKCEEDLEKEGDGFKCLGAKCSFYITLPKLKKMVNDMCNVAQDEVERAEFYELLETFEE